MKSMMILVLLSGVFAKPVPEASKTVPAPTNAPPTMVTVGQIDRNIGEIRVKVLQQVPVTVTKVVQEVVNVNGNQVVVERAVAETTMKTQISERKVKIDGTLKIMEATGEKMAKMRAGIRTYPISLRIILSLLSNCRLLKIKHY